MANRLQRVVLNGQALTWQQILASVPQGSVLGPQFFLIYINDLPQNLQTTVKIFADDTSLFSVVNDPVSCANKVNVDLYVINERADQWNMSFNYHPSKQAVEIYFSRKSVPIHAPGIMFSGCIVFNQEFNKHLGVVLDRKLTFDHHLRDKLSKANKGIGLISRLRKFLPRDTLLTIYRAFVRPHLDYGDVIYDNPGNASFSQQLESIQYSAALEITGCIRETSKDKLYCELGLETLADRRFCRRLCIFYKIVNDIASSYLLA